MSTADAKSGNKNANGVPCHKCGEELRVGSTARLCHLQSNKGKTLNETTVVDIVEGLNNDNRYKVKFVEADDSNENGGKAQTIMCIKPQNLRLVCSAPMCHSDQAEFLRCSACRVVVYCDAKCQKAHWKSHKSQCKAWKEIRKSKPKNKNKAGCWHASWDQHLSFDQQQAIVEFHNDLKCPTPWPVTGVETPSMLLFPMPCFLQAHPNMKFNVTMEEMPGGFTMFYDDDATSEISGKRAPTGCMLPMLKEDVTAFAGYDGTMGVIDTMKLYSQAVPLHNPVQIVFAVIAEVPWTTQDYQDFKSYFDQDLGRLFVWPGAECVGICPGTGERVPFDKTNKHLLVACVLLAARESGGDLHTATRVMPRILTKRGYEQIMGTGQRRQLVIENKPVDFLKAFRRDGLWQWACRGKVERGQQQPSFYTASEAYSDFHASSMYKVFERWVDESKAPQSTRYVADKLGLRMGRG